MLGRDPVGQVNGKTCPVKTLAGDSLLNETYDRQTTRGDGWGLVSGLDGCVSNDGSDKDAGYKGRSGI